MKTNISDTNNHLSDLIRISSYLVSNICERQLIKKSASIKLSTNQFYILKILSSESSVNISNLAKILLISNAAVGKIIDKLIDHKLVSRRFMKADRRTAMISITTKGKEIVKKYNNLIIDRQIENFNQFSLDDKVNFQNYLKLYIRNCLNDEIDTNILCCQCQGYCGGDCVVEERNGSCLKKKELINGN